MGWDAYSTPYTPNSPFGDRAWDDAVAEARKRAETIDGLLSSGGLDVSTCGAMLSLATGRSVYDDNDWAPEFVQALAKSADWAFDVEKDQAWAKESARVFLEHCAKLGKGIEFSY